MTDINDVSMTSTLAARDEVVKREVLEKELAELTAENEAATTWGAAVGARSERIKAIESLLSRPAQEPLPSLVDRDELIKLLEDLASVNLSREAAERQARRMADDLIARGLYPQSGQTKAWKCLAVSKAACAWPDCGCDPAATDVIRALVDQGWQAPSQQSPGGHEEMESYRLALAWISKQSTDPASREQAAAALEK